MPKEITTRTKQLGVRKLANLDIDYKQYSVKSTFSRVPDSRIVVVPWRVFSADPESVCDSFRELSGEDQITYADDINVMMNVEGLKTPQFGSLNEFSQAWVITTDEINLDNIIDHLKSYQILLGVTLSSRNLLGDHMEIPMVAFVDHKTPEVREAIMKLETYRDLLAKSPDTKFCVEVDIGPSVSRWASQILGQSMVCVGGRFHVTNGEIFNHVFDCSNICAFLPVILCCLVAIPIYRLKRKITINDHYFPLKGDTCILGAATLKVADQRIALLTLMRRARTDMKFAPESPDSGVYVTSPAKVHTVQPMSSESFSKKNDKTAILKTHTPSRIKPKPAVINMNYKDKNKKKTQEEEKKDEEKDDTAQAQAEALPEQEEIQLSRENSYMQADDLDTIARAFKMSKAAAEPRPSVASPITLSNFRADLLFCDIDDSDEEKHKTRGEGNFLDPNYDEVTDQLFKKNPNPLSNIELMHFLTTKNKPASIRNEEEQRRLEMAKKKRKKVGKGWSKVQANFDSGNIRDEELGV